MEFGQQPTTPPPGRAPHPRHRPSIDDIAPPPRHHVAPQPMRRDASQPVYVQRGGDYLRGHNMAAQRPPEQAQQQPMPQPNYEPQPQPVEPQPAPTPWVHPAPVSAPRQEWTPPARSAPQPAPQPQAAPTHQPEHLDFRPNHLKQVEPEPAEEKPKKPKLHKRAAHKAKKAGHGLKKIAPKLAIAVVVFGLLGTGGWLIERHFKAQTPEAVFEDTLLNMLATPGLTTSISEGPTSQTVGPTNTAQVDYNLSVTTNPIISSTATINYYGSQFTFKGFGDLKTNYISYQDLPPAISKDIVKVVQNRWVRLRANGLEGTGVPGLLQNLSDPHYQAFGPVIFGNFTQGVRERLINYALAKHVYTYKQTAITKATINGQKVLIYPVKLNVSYLKILNQSAASSEGIEPNDVQAAVDALNIYDNATVELAINPSTHQVVRLTANRGNQITTIDYSNFGKYALPSEPITNLNWTQFKLTQLQIESQAAARETASQIDAQRQGDFAATQAYLETYFKINGFYPLLSDLNDQTWMAANLPGYDTDNLHSPLANNSLLAATTSPTNYSYQALPDSGTGLCDDTPINPCTHYALSTNMSNGQLYTVTDLDK